MEKHLSRLFAPQAAFFNVLILLAAGLFLAACGKQSSPDSGSANPGGITPATSSTALFTGPIVETMNAGQFVDHASKINKENPTKPEWPFVTVEGADLHLAAQPINQTTTTLVQVPLVAGSYNLKTSALLSPTSEFPVQFSVTLLRGGSQASIFSTDFRPGDTRDLDQNFAVPSGQCELMLIVKMTPAAANHYGATLYLRGFELGKRG